MRDGGAGYLGLTSCSKRLRADGGLVMTDGGNAAGLALAVAAMVGATAWATRVLRRFDVQVGQPGGGDLDDITPSSYCACGNYRSRCPRCG